MQLIRSFFASKKGVAMIAGVIVAAVGRVGLDLPTDAVTQIVAPIVAYILGQGAADIGKEALRLEIAQEQQFTASASATTAPTQQVV